MKASTRIKLAKHSYWKDIAGKVFDIVGTVALSLFVWYIIIDGLFPNKPLG